MWFHEIIVTSDEDFIKMAFQTDMYVSVYDAVTLHIWSDLFSTTHVNTYWMD